jgi:hypothetical protein
MAAEYKVTDSVEMTGIDKARGIFKFRRYTLQTKGGSVITVELEEKNWTPEKAAPIFLKAATEEDKIRAL